MKTFTEEAKEVRLVFSNSFSKENHLLSNRVRTDADTLLIMYDQMVDYHSQPNRMSPSFTLASRIHEMGLITGEDFEKFIMDETGQFVPPLIGQK